MSSVISNVIPLGPVEGYEQRTVQSNVAQSTSDAIKNSLNMFDDEVNVPTSDDVKKANDKINRFNNYIQSEEFRNNCLFISQVFNIPPKQVANNFFEKCLGTVGDVAGIAVNTTGNVAHSLVDLIANIAHGAISVFCNVANALISMVTLNKTCIA